MNRQELKDLIDLYTWADETETEALLSIIEIQALHLAKGLLGILDSVQGYTFVDPGVWGAIKQATRPLYEERTER